MKDNIILSELEPITNTVRVALINAYKLGREDGFEENLKSKSEKPKKMYTDEQVKAQLIKSNRVVINKTVEMCIEAVKKCYTHYNYTLPDDLTKEQMDQLVIKPFNYICSELEKLKKMRILTK